MTAEQLREAYRQYRDSRVHTNPLGETHEQKAGYLLLLHETAAEALAGLDQREEKQREFTARTGVQPDGFTARTLGLELDFAEVRALLEAAE